MSMENRIMWLIHKLYNDPEVSRLHSRIVCGLTTESDGNKLANILAYRFIYGAIFGFIWGIVICTCFYIFLR